MSILIGRAYDGFTKSQIKAIEIFKDWWDKPFTEEHWCFSLLGSAGTGKTYLLNYLINEVIDKSCCITAPTHKALRVLEKKCGRRGKTLQSLHGLRPNIDMETFDISNPQFDPRGTVHMANFNVVVIDECSMVNKDLNELNKQRALEYRVKVLYCGDPYQLPPVKETMSVSFRSSDRVILTDIVRQDADNPVLELFDILRKDIANNTNNLIKHIIKNREKIHNGRGYRLYNMPNFTKEILEYYRQEEFYNNIEYIRTLAYTNNRIRFWNEQLRKVVVGDMKDLVTTNDLFTANVNLVDEFGSPIIINSEDYIALSVDDIITSEGIKCFVVVLQSCFDRRKTSPIMILDHNHKESMLLYGNIASSLFQTAISTKNKKMWQAFFEFRKRILTMTPIKIGYKEVKPDMSYGYAITTHKSQGSTFNNVAVDLVDIFFPTNKYGNKMINDRTFANQLAYVALSRMENIALIQY